MVLGCASPAWSETAKVKVATQIGLAYLPLIIMQHDKLWEAKANDLGVPLEVVAVTGDKTDRSLMEEILKSHFSRLATSAVTVAHHGEFGSTSTGIGQRSMRTTALDDHPRPTFLILNSRQIGRAHV